ncbi:MAG: alkaline phosphatase family protein [Anaerolineae bacterium]|nr:alkaline phosphatase family protein [Anaerolineae bacterium]
MTTRAVKIAFFIIVLLLLAVAGYEAKNLALMGWNSVVEYNSPYLFPLPRTAPTEPLTERVVLVVIDGLRLDASQQMDALNELRRLGADLVLRAGQPSLSYPSWTVITSGAWQEISGITTNWYKGAVRVDHIFQVAKDAGKPAVVVGAPGWRKLFDPADAFAAHEPEETAPPEKWTRFDEETLRLALEALDRYDTGLVLIHFGGTDGMAHNFGGVSTEYLNQVRAVDRHLEQLASHMDWDRDTLIVTADHGHIDAGGHGGWEESVLNVPLVMVGKGVRRGAYAPRVQADLAPTVAALLGLPYPTHSQGVPLLELLEASAETKGVKGLNAALQLAGFYDGYASTLSVRPFAGEVLNKYRADLARGEEGAMAKFWEELNGSASRARTGRLWRERLLRLPIALAVALLPLLYLLIFRRRWRYLAVPVGFALLYFVLYNLLFFGKGYTWSLSLFNYEEQIEAFFTARLVDAAFAAGAAGLLLALISWKKSPLEATERMVTFSFAVWYSLLLQVDLFYWLYSIKFTWALPDLKLGFKYYMDLLQMIPIGFLATILTLLALLIGWGMRRLRCQVERSGT